MRWFMRTPNIMLEVSESASHIFPCKYMCWVFRNLVLGPEFNALHLACWSYGAGSILGMLIRNKQETTWY